MNYAVVIIIVLIIICFQIKYYKKNIFKIDIIKNIFPPDVNKELVLTNTNNQIKISTNNTLKIENSNLDLNKSIILEKSNLEELEHNLSKKEKELEFYKKQIANSTNNDYYQANINFDIKQIDDLKYKIKSKKDEIQRLTTLVVTSNDSKETGLVNILKTINNYLSNNKNLANDFHLIKDIVDRNSDSLEEEINTLTPIPLYLGLIGTMFGIIIGLGGLVITGGIDALTEGSSDGIKELLGGVALAMISSICGILLSTHGSIMATKAKAALIENKNEFLSWIQSNLLPKMSDSATSAIYTLQSNLSSFNNAFSGNIKEMKSAFAQMNTSNKDQLLMLQTIEKMNMTQMAKANVAVLTELQKSTQEFERFNQYLHSVNNYLDQVNHLNTNINQHLNRTKAIEDMGTFFREEIAQIDNRKSFISQSIGSVDTMLATAINNLQENSKKQVESLVHFTTEQNIRFNQALEEQGESLRTKLEEVTVVVEELKNLSSVKSTLTKMEKYSNEQNKKIESLTSAILELAKKKNEDVVSANAPTSTSYPKWLIIFVVSSLGIISFSCFVFLVNTIIDIIFK